uniref:COP9 signalosome complex subunit 3 putative n=1 Tax=Albugo laibachii Nc14 TaxID=890382 RepID=F0W9S3_9STRA|nr:COP9 signalosome complex subunit 3 putative [Albugo laibachii Nc14]|eukprot:CCA17891.1 COP9 signalosome complex subunit 3 putative [Albugo laibachii Nc14]
MSLQMEPDNWDSLSFLQAFVQKEGHSVDGDKKQSDFSVARLLASDDKVAQMENATSAQFDQVLCSDFFALEKRPLCFLILLSHKAAKIRVAKTDLSKSNSDSSRTDESHPAMTTIYNYNEVVLLLQQFVALTLHLPIAIAFKEPKTLYKLCGNIAQIASDAKLSARILYPLKSLLRRFYNNGFNAITPIHGEFFHLCIQSKHYASALDIVTLPLVEVEKEHNGMTSLSFLKYGYYSGVIYLSQKRMQEAISAFLMTISTPATVLSAFVVEAYKKMLLSSLILHGRIQSIPQYAPYVVSRHVDSHCIPYTEFAHAFEQSNFRDLDRITHVYREQSFVKDGNFGLVKQCLVAFKQQTLLKIHQIYNRVPLTDILAIIGQNMSDWNMSISEIEHLFQSNKSENVSVRIDQEKNLIVFQSDNTFDSNKMQQHDVMGRLDAGMQQLLRITDHWRKIDAEIVQHPRFIAHLQQDREKIQPRGPSLVNLGLTDEQKSDPRDMED